MRRMVVGRKEEAAAILLMAYVFIVYFSSPILKPVARFASGYMIFSSENTVQIVGSDENLARRNGQTREYGSKKIIGLCNCLFVRQVYEKVY
jgi:hypothetical protein